MKTYAQFFEEDEKISKSDLKVIEKELDKLWKVLKIDIAFTNHFFQRLNDPRNKKQISKSDLVDAYQKLFKKFGKKISGKIFQVKTKGEFEAVIKDINSNINVPFALKFDADNNELDLVAQTILRKKGFKSSDPEFKV